MFLLYCIIQSFKPDWTTFETIWKLQEFNANRMTTSILVITKFGTCIQTKLHDPHDSCTGNTAAFNHIHFNLQLPVNQRQIRRICTSMSHLQLFDWSISVAILKKQLKRAELADSGRQMTEDSGVKRNTGKNGSTRMSSLYEWDHALRKN